MNVTRRSATAVAAVALTALVASGLSGCTSTLGYAAVVNGAVISQATLNQDLADVGHSAAYVSFVNQNGAGPVAGSSAGTFNKTFVAELLGQIIRDQVLHQKLVAANKLPTAPQVVAAKTEISQAFPSGVFSSLPARYQDVLATGQAGSDNLIGIVASTESTDALNQYYQAHTTDYTTEACVRQILIADGTPTGQLDVAASQSQAQKVKALLDAGGDFTALAGQYSQDNQTSTGTPTGGVVTGSAPDGCLAESDIRNLAAQPGLATIAQAIVQLPVNQVSNPVATQNGFYLLEVTKRVTEPLDSSVSEDIEARLAGDQLDQLVAKAHVKINPEFGTFDKTLDVNGSPRGVVPPPVPTLGTTTTSTIPGS